MLISAPVNSSVPFWAVIVPLLFTASAMELVPPVPVFSSRPWLTKRQVAPFWPMPASAAKL